MEESSRAFPAARVTAESMIWSVVDVMDTYTRGMELAGIPLSAWKAASVDLQARGRASVQTIAAERRTDDVQTTRGVVLVWAAGKVTREQEGEGLEDKVQRLTKRRPAG